MLHAVIPEEYLIPPGYPQKLIMHAIKGKIIYGVSAVKIGIWLYNIVMCINSI